MPERRPQCYVIAGPNGAGKTTFAREFLPRYVHCLEFVNPDLIALGLSPFDARRAAAAAARLVLARIREHAKAGADFAMETTLSGRTYLPMLKRIRKAAYQVHLFYLWLPSVELALGRVADRVRQGGHDVPEADVRRGYSRTLWNLFHLYAPFLNSLHFFDNSGLEPDLVFQSIGAGIRIVQPEKYAKILRRANT